MERVERIFSRPKGGMKSSGGWSSCMAISCRYICVWWYCNIITSGAVSKRTSKDNIEFTIYVVFAGFLPGLQRFLEAGDFQLDHRLR
jgi:hypothetical protein